jgi:glycosyltransferase involved in cell wall biosynthesis
MVSSSPLVSVVIPFKDAGAFLREAVDSVHAQTYEHWELVLVDDGSRDDSTEIARQCALADPQRVRYVQHEGGVNRGISISRNVGIRLTRGPLIALLDADDVWLPHKLADQVALLDAHPDAVMVYGESQYWYSWTGRAEDLGRDLYPALGVDATTVLDPPVLLVRCLLGQAAVPCPCSVVVRRETIDQVGGFEEGFNDIIEDQAFYAKVMLRARVLVATERWDRYRRHDASVSAAAKRRGAVHAARLRYLAWLRGYLASLGMTSGPAWDAVDRATWRARHPRLTSLPGATRLIRWLAPVDGDSG